MLGGATLGGWLRHAKTYQNTTELWDNLNLEEKFFKFRIL
jgi:hypothetical protein